MSERIQGSFSNTRIDREKDLWYSGVAATGLTITSEVLMKTCDSLANSSPPVWRRLGEHWMGGRYADTPYNHIAPPNWSGTDCSSENPFGDPGDISGAVLTARSYHRGGVHVLRMDGSARMVKDSIDLTIWRALGTRAGNENLSVD